MQLGAPVDGEDLVRTTLDQWQEAAASARVAFESSSDETEVRQAVQRLLRAYMAQVSCDEPCQRALTCRHRGRNEKQPF